MKKRFLAGALALVLVVSLVSAALATTASAAEASAAQTLSYENLEQQLREHGPSYLMLEETVKSIESVDYEKMKDDLRDNLSKLGKAQWGIMQMGKMPSVSSSANYSYTYGQLDQANASMRESFEALKDGDVQEDNAAIVRQLRDTQNQMLLGAQSLYVALLEMDSGHTQLKRELAAMDRTVAEMTLRHQRGQISDLQLEQVQSGREQMNSALTTLERNIQLYTVQLQSMLGMELTGELTLSEVPEITDAQIREMNYEKDLAAAREVSYTLYSADKDLEDAKESYLEVARQYGFNESRYEFISARHTYQAAQYTHAVAQQAYEMDFMTVFTAVADYQQALKAAKSALEAEKIECAAQELKYKQGNLSQNAFLNAQDDLAEAEAAVLTAKHDLFTAWLTYRQAVELGVMS